MDKNKKVSSKQCIYTMWHKRSAVKTKQNPLHENKEKKEKKYWMKWGFIAAKSVLYKLKSATTKNLTSLTRWNPKALLYGKLLS